MKSTALSGILMTMLAVTCIVIALVGLKDRLKHVDWSKASKKRVFLLTTLFAGIWMILLGILSAVGFFEHFDTIPPRPLLAVVPPIVLLTILAFTEWFSNILSVTPAHWLVFFQSFRIAVELLLWQAYERGLIPVQMTFEGRNYDIISGILALFAGYIMWKHPKAAKPVGLIYNLIGLVLLINIIIIAILSMPTAFRYFMNEPANTIVAYFPFIYLPGVLVVLAFTFHIFSLRQLFFRQDSRIRDAPFKLNKSV